MNIDYRPIDPIPDPADGNNNGTPDLFEMDRIRAGEYEIPPLPDPPKRNFITDILRGIRRTVKAKNTAGKILYSVLGIGGASAFAPNELTTILGLLPMEINLLDAGIYLIIVAITFLTSRGLVKGLLNDILTEVKQAAGVLRKVRQADSPGGREITDKERELLLKEADDILTLIWRRLLRNRIANLFGISASNKNQNSETSNSY